MTRKPVAVLTNGSLLWMDEVQDALLAADLVLPSLDAGDECLFQRVKRPHEAISFERMVGGLASFTKRFRGEVWLEILLLADVTGVPSQVEKIAEIVREIGPARVQLNTASRPPSEVYARPVPDVEMHALASLIPGRVEVLTTGAGVRAPGGDSPTTSEAEIVKLLGRRPCTARDVAEGLGIHLTEALKHLEQLVAARSVESVTSGGLSYYIASREGTKANNQD
jgi:wyosine [tRNA(Phe)-imidazoG37] synthetase (radical SAM superfamily)